MLRKSGSAVKCVVTQWSTVQSGGPSDQAVVLLPLTINNLVSVPDCVTLVRLCHNNLVSVPDCVTQHSHSKWGTIEGSGVITLQWSLLTTKLPRPGTWDWWSLLGSIKHLPDDSGLNIVILHLEAPDVSGVTSWDPHYVRIERFPSLSSPHRD